jgi:predicted secreted acid phosphatase
LVPARATLVLAGLLAAVAMLVTGISLADEPKAPASPEDILAYHDSGEWKADTTAQVDKARKFVKKWLADHKPPRKSKPAIVLDIDDTSLSLYACAKARDFDGAVLCAVQPNLPAIPQVRSFFRYAQKHHVAVFFITGRPEALGDFTKGALRQAGYKGSWKLYLKPSDYDKASVVPYKSSTRKRIIRRGYRILANLGDQRSDLKGGYSLKAYKLPNPMYFTP